MGKHFLNRNIGIWGLDSGLLMCAYVCVYKKTAMYKNSVFSTLVGPFSGTMSPAGLVKTWGPGGRTGMRKRYTASALTLCTTSRG